MSDRISCIAGDIAPEQQDGMNGAPVIACEQSGRLQIIEIQ